MLEPLAGRKAAPSRYRVDRSALKTFQLFDDG
jgi:hypothetical protein